MLWDGEKTAKSIYAYLIEKLEDLEVSKFDLMGAINILKNVLTDNNLIESVKQLRQNLFTAAKHWLEPREGRGIIERLKQVIKQIDYEFYLLAWN